MFKGRVDAARMLLSTLKKFEGNSNTCIVGLLRGGIVTAKVLSEFLLLPLQGLIVKKIGAPHNSELAIGAMVDEKNIFWNDDLLENLGVKEEEKKILAENKMQEIKFLKKQLKIPSFKAFKNVILVDDGVATGATVMAAQKFVKNKKVHKVYLATPVISFDTERNISKYFDGVYSLEKPLDFYAVSQVYQNFPQVTSEEVSSILHQ
jgi:putative phosphoribosyl transferase